MGALPPADPERLREATVWSAYISHFAGTLSLAPSRGHPAYLYQSLPSLMYWATEYPDRVMAGLRERDLPGVERLNADAAEVAALAAQIRSILLDPPRAAARTQASLAAADQLLALTEARLQQKP